MEEKERIAQIESRLKNNDYFINPHSNFNVKYDLVYLLTLIQEKDKKIDFLEKKVDVVSTQMMELSQEIENVKSDFGNQR